VDYAQASAIGDVGERRVGDALRSESAALGSVVIDNILLVDDRTTAQIDHLIVDRFGIVVVETKNYHASLRGKSADKRWTACYRGTQRRNETFLNPLRQNDRHREVLHHVLEASGRRLPTEYMQSLIVFAGGDIGKLKLDDHDRMRVVSDREVIEYLRARAGDFSPNPGALDAEQVRDLVSLLNSVNQAGSAAAQALHADNIHNATRRFGRKSRPEPSRPEGVGQSPMASTPAYNQWNRFPEVPVVPTRRRPSEARGFVTLLPIVLIALVGGWFVYGGGESIANSAMVRMLTPSISQVAPISAATPSSAASSIAGADHFDVPLALKRLKAADPALYKRLVDRENPSLSSTGGLPTYTWQYIAKTASNSAGIASVSVTLDNSGKIVGVSGR
jgi:hypothetical protein